MSDDELVHAVILARPEALDPAKIAAVFGPFKKIPFQDAVRLAKNCWGVVSREGSPMAAEGLRAALTAAGLPSLVVRSDSLLDLPDARQAKKIVFGEKALEDQTPVAPLVPPGPRSLPWAALSVIALAGYSETSHSTVKVKEGPDATERAINMGLLATGIPIKVGKKSQVVEKSVETSELVFHLQLCFEEPRLRLHVNAQSFDYSCLGALKQYNALANMKTLVAEIAKRAPRALRSRGARVFLENRQIREMGYDSLADLEKESRWLRTLASLQAA